MDWIFDNFQIVAIIAIVLGSFVKQFLEAKAEERRAREEMERNPPEEVFGPDEEWETVPTAPPPMTRPSPPPLSQPPPLAQPPPLRRSVEADEAVLRRQEEMQERLRLAREAKAAKTREAAAVMTTGSTARTVRKTGLRGALANRAETRRAIVLREILGPPLGLR